MNEEEAFIRTIVDNPGDDTARLVYADWLDEHDDPRGAYMRAEREAVTTGDTEKLSELAAGLDPVWIARVSLPPVGVCCNGFLWSRHGEAVSNADLDRFEARFGIVLPFQYRAFLLNYNGGEIELNVGASRRYCYFNSVAKTSGNDPELSLEHEFAVRRNSVFRGTPRENDEFRVRLRNSMIIGSISASPAWMLMGIGEKNNGRIRFLTQSYAAASEAILPEVRSSFDSLADYLLYLLQYETSS